MEFNQGVVTKRSMPFWCVGNPCGDPFGPAVLPKIDSIKVAEILAWGAKEGLLEMTSAHDDDMVPWDAANPCDDMDPNSECYKTISKIKEILDAAGIEFNAMTCGLHGDPAFRNGGLANPDPAVRELARLKVERAIRIGNRLNAKLFVYWVARDGFEVPVVTQWDKVYDWIADGLNHARDYMKENNFTNYVAGTIEPKPNEPRGQMFIPTSGHAVGFIMTKLTEPSFWGVNPELLQHESMALLNAVMTVSYLHSLGKLTMLHFGCQVKGQFDNDNPPLIGPEGLKETVFMFWALKKIGWKGVVEFDCHMLRAESDPAEYIECRKQFIRDSRGQFPKIRESLFSAVTGLFEKE